ncbi:MAG TPA: AP protein [Planctomycetota bacterium]
MTTSAFLLLLALFPQAERKTENVVLVTWDGFRPEEVFTGAEQRLLPPKDEELRKAFWRETARERREALLPFLWSVVARDGRLLRGRVTNGLNFSYPGYGELLSGFPDPKIDSNKKIPNENPTVLEWLSKRPGFEGKVAAFCCWDVFPSIFNKERSGLPTFAGEIGPAAKGYEDLLREIPTPWNGCTYDMLAFRPALDYLKARKPRVLYISLGETDEWAHAGRYDRYLQAARRSDDYLRLLWETLQAMPEYAGRTTLLVTTDHGRGVEGTKWRDHGKDVDGAEKIWLAALGPDLPPAGEAKESFTQAQVAATVAAVLGEDYRRDVPKAAAPLFR